MNALDFTISQSESENIQSYNKRKMIEEVQLKLEMWRKHRHACEFLAPFALGEADMLIAKAEKELEELLRS